MSRHRIEREIEMTSRYDRTMRNWQGLDSSFDGTVPPSRRQPIVFYHKRLEGYDGSFADLELLMETSGQLVVRSSRDVFRAPVQSMREFFQEGLKAIDDLTHDPDPET